MPLLEPARYVDVDKFSLLAVATRPDVKMILPQRARLSGGTEYNLDW